MIGQDVATHEIAEQVDALQGNLEAAAGSAGELTAEMAKLRDNMLFTRREVGSLASSFSGTLKRAFDDVVFEGKGLSDALRGVALSMAGAIYNTAMRPVQDTIGAAVAGGIDRLVGSAIGGGIGARVEAFADGGVLDGPVSFPMRRGIGLMGEAGPEAIMPLARGSDGKLGVRAQGTGAPPVHVTFNVSTPDVDGFRRSQTQIAAQMTRALGRAARNR